MPPKIFISHSSKDNDFATKLAVHLKDKFGENKVYIDLFNLDGGSNLATVIPRSIEEANWFILLASKASMASSWVKYEATLATFLDIERENFNILTVKLDDCQFPSELSTQLRMRKYLELSPSIFDKIVHILQNETGLSVGKTKYEPFVGRGQEQDNIEIAVARHKIVLLLGMPGIGKSSLVRKLATSRFNRDIIQINLRVSHDMELLTRQIISSTGNIQPAENEDHEFLLDTCIHLLKERINSGAMLFLNDAQNTINFDGEFQPFLRDFLKQYVDASISFPVFIASTRVTTFTPDETLYSLPVRISPLRQDLMIIAIQQWFSFMNPDAHVYSDKELAPLADKLGGHPLAARLVAGSLSFQNITNLSTDTSMTKFQHSIAEFILSKISLIEIDRFILYAMAVYQSGITIRYLMAIKQIAQLGQSEVLKSLERLSKTLLVSQEFDTYVLHNFILAYFLDEALDKKLYQEFANDLAEISYNDTLLIVKSLNKIPKESRTHTNLFYVTLSRNLIQVAIPTHRLLLLTGKRKLLDDIPYKLKGHIREMVFVMYERANNYNSCIEYAKEWLKINPNDSQVMLYQIRAYRQLEQYSEAEKLLEKLEQEIPNSGSMLHSQIWREKGRIAYQQNNQDLAINLYKAGLREKRDGTPMYPQINIDYVRSLVAKANFLWDGDPQIQEYYELAYEAIEKARPHIPRFEQFNQGLYAQVLLQTERINAFQAIEMLEGALASQPTKNGQLYLQLANLLKDTNPQKALDYARQAKNSGAKGASLTLVEVYLNLRYFDAAVKELDSYEPQQERDIIIGKMLRARSYTGKQEYDKSRSILNKLERNSFVTRSLIENEVAAANAAINQQRYSEATRLVNEIQNLLQSIRQSNYKYDNQYEIRVRNQIDKIKQHLD